MVGVVPFGWLLGYWEVNIMLNFHVFIGVYLSLF